MGSQNPVFPSLAYYLAAWHFPNSWVDVDCSVVAQPGPWTEQESFEKPGVLRKLFHGAISFALMFPSWGLKQATKGTEWSLRAKRNRKGTRSWQDSFCVSRLLVQLGQRPGCPLLCQRGGEGSSRHSFSLGCWWWAQVLDEVERRRGISAALVYPFMRSLMESPFPAPGKTIKVKTFLPGAGNEVGNCCSFLFWPWAGSREEPGQPECSL